MLGITLGGVVWNLIYIQLAHNNEEVLDPRKVRLTVKLVVVVYL